MVFWEADTPTCYTRHMKYVALLRGINVGGNKKVPMVDLRDVFTDLGFRNVSTYINSGNVIFESAKKPNVANIEQALAQTFGFELRIVLRSKENILHLARGIPMSWHNNQDEKTDILFLWQDFDSKDSLDLVNATPVDTLRYIDGAIVWHIKKKDYNKSGMNKFIGTPLYKNMTARNINTVRKLAELMAKDN